MSRSRNVAVLTTMVTALAVLALVPLLALWGVVELAGDSPQGLAGVGSACVVLSVGLLVVVRVADEGGPAGLARDRGGTVASGSVAAAGDPVREPVDGRDCAGYLYAVEYAPSDGTSRPGSEWAPLVSGLVASGSLVVETADSRVALPVSRAVEPSFASPAAAAPEDLDLDLDLVGDPAAYLRRLGVEDADAYHDRFLRTERVRVVVEAFTPGDPVTLVGTFAERDGAVEPTGDVVVRRAAAEAWARTAARTLRLARRIALVVGPVGAVLVVAGLVLSAA